ncbi:CPBP family intramembrane glutamic endopeptidase [Thioalkalicoccus limnaeus]|uniref:CPBP family intramembrane glutamic endopeptidase n=1 Tax=Thioalkalicoccus limnaeus TaxID=120681 RepID=A0ABV4BFQ7_9GAMM
MTALVPFLVISFGLAWGILALYLFLPEPMMALFGQLSGQHPLFFVAVYAPAIAALITVGFIAGAAGLRRFLSRLLLWRTSPGWFLFLLFGVPLIYYASAAAQGLALSPPTPFATVSALLAALFFMAIKGPVEEIGWRGLALPLLQRRFAPFWAGLILGIVWGLWHLPAFLLSGTPQSEWSFAPFFLGAVAISIIVTPMFNQSGGSILLPALFHFQLINPIWPDAQPYDTVLFVAAAAVVVWIHRQALFNRPTAVTEVIPSHPGQGGTDRQPDQDPKGCRG